LRQRPRLRPAALPLAIAALAASACGAPAPTPPVPAGTTAASLVTVSADPGALRAGVARRALLGANFQAQQDIATVRLVAVGPELGAPLTSAAVAVSWNGSAPTTQEPIALAVPAGPNRAFALEGLDADGHVIASLATLATVKDAATALTFNADSDAAGRVLMDLYAAGLGTDALATALKTADQTAGLLGFVNGLTGYDASANTFGGVNPLGLDRATLIGRLQTQGVAMLTKATAQALPGTDALKQEAWAKVRVQIVGLAGTADEAASPGSVTVDVFDPFSSSVAGRTSEVTLPRVVPGDWAVRVRDALESRPYWGTLHVDATGFAVVSVVQAGSAGTLALPQGAHRDLAIASNTAGDRMLAVWADGAAIKGEFLDGQGVPLQGAAPFTIGANPAEGAYMTALNADPIVGNRAATLSVTYNPTHQEYLVAWSNKAANHVWAKRVDAATQAAIGRDYAFAAPQAQVYDSLGGAVPGTFITAGPTGVSAVCEAGGAGDAHAGEYLVAWADQGGTPGVKLVHFAHDAADDAAPTRVAAGTTVPTNGPPNGDHTNGSSAGFAAATFNAGSGTYDLAWLDAAATKVNLLRVAPDGTFDPASAAQVVVAGLSYSHGLAIAADPQQSADLVAWTQAVGGAAIKAVRFASGQAGSVVTVDTQATAFRGVAAAYQPPAGPGQAGFFHLGFSRDGKPAERRLKSDLGFDNRGVMTFDASGSSSVPVPFLAQNRVGLGWALNDGAAELGRLSLLP
jgi:hypothetical protein